MAALSALLIAGVAAESPAGALYVSDGDRCRALLAALAAIDGGGDDDEASPT